MRTLGFRTHVLMVLAGAAGVLATLGRPWYDRQPPPAPDTAGRGFDVHGPLHATLQALGRWLGATGGTTGWDALGPWAAALAALSLMLILGALGACVPALQGIVRAPLRFGSLAVITIVLWRLVDSPGPNEDLELRLGALVAFAAALMLWAAAQGVAAAPLRRRAAAPRFERDPALR